MPKRINLVALEKCRRRGGGLRGRRRDLQKMWLRYNREWTLQNLGNLLPIPDTLPALSQVNSYIFVVAVAVLLLVVAVAVLLLPVAVAVAILAVGFFVRGVAHLRKGRFSGRKPTWPFQA